MKIKNLPPSKNIETQTILKKAIKANRALAQLNGTAKIIPNQNILINALVLQEAKDSSEIENIITTHDELFRAGIDIESVTNETKEVQHYKEALIRGYELVRDNGLLLKRDIVEIQGILEQNDAGVRRQSGTVLRNMATGEVVFEPPQDYETIQELQTASKYLNELEKMGLMKNIQIKNSKFFVHKELFDRLRKGV